MKVRVLGCSGAIARHARTTSFLIDESPRVDAGTGVGDLTLDEMARIDHVLLTHSHLDHVACEILDASRQPPACRCQRAAFSRSRVRSASARAACAKSSPALA